jgi:hypothetical protein
MHEQVFFQAIMSKSSNFTAVDSDGDRIVLEIIAFVEFFIDL